MGWGGFISLTQHHTAAQNPAWPPQFCHQTSVSQCSQLKEGSGVMILWGSSQEITHSTQEVLQKWSLSFPLEATSNPY